MKKNAQEKIGSFYPRHPRGWRLRNQTILSAAVKVSIHATLAGGDAMYSLPCAAASTFLSTPPSRVATYIAEKEARSQQVSIHATLAGGDLCSRRKNGNQASFYPRHPRGWRRRHTADIHRHRAVSIHATLAGGDLCRCGTARKHKAFLSTPPSRVATQGQCQGC